MRHPSPFLLLLLLGGLLACGDEPLPGLAPPPAETGLVGTLRYGDGSPAAGLRLGLFRLEDLRHAAAETTAVDGSFAFLPLPPGSYVPVSLDRRALLLDLPASGLVVAPEETLRVRLRALARPTEGPLAQGVVVDATTGRPVQGALVEVGTAALTPPEIEGRLGPSRAVTDAVGRFALEDFLIFPEPDRPGFSRSADLLIHAPGYRGLRRPGLTPQDLPATGLRYELSPGVDEAVLAGRVVDLALRPLEGVGLGLEWVSRPEFLFKDERLVLQQKVAVSDAQGLFRLEGLPSGLHHVAVGYRPDDGWLRVVPENLPPEAPALARPTVSLAAGESLFVATLPAVEAVRPLQPADGAVAPSQPDFAWEDWPWMGTSWGSTWILLLAPYGTGDRDQWRAVWPLDRPALAWPDPDFHLPPGRHFWRVEPFDGWAARLPLFETWASFTVVDSPVDTLILPSPASSWRCNPPAAWRVQGADGS